MGNEFFEGLSGSEEQERDASSLMQEKYRHVFLSSEMGIDVLGDILQTCHFGCTLSSEAQMDEYNVGAIILNKLGIFGPETLREVVMALSRVQINRRDKK